MQTSHNAPAPEHNGTQSIERALRILRELAARGEFGWRLSDLATRCEVDKGTVHRILSCLVRERFVQQRSADKHYFPGPMLYELGLSLPGYATFRQACERRLAKYAVQTEAIAWLILRSGNEYVCAVRKGTLELRGLMVHVGTRRPLFTSVGGVAILQTLPMLEAENILADNTQQEIAKRGDGRLAALRKMRERSQRHGFGVNLGDVVPGVHAFAVPVCGGDGRAIAAVVLTGLPEQFGEARLPEIRQALSEVAAAVQSDAHQFLGSMMPAAPAAFP
ncbi:IclR family transcriptional regulator [Variovorax sp. PBL-E5]|uniref:IclR family transcriptional regulator n=1 Tax=Variovorax sp. PBL-E5 TaxID=434014 RepID=UPI001316636D|nr:IclR family transcriptional regulator [Variovorax sp. PBL-E5]VTU22483.1 Glycerol operon regulatory protein [Variovorax sp. PBL-E5]